MFPDSLVAIPNETNKVDLHLHFLYMQKLFSQRKLTKQQLFFIVDEKFNSQICNLDQHYF